MAPEMSGSNAMIFQKVMSSQEKEKDISLVFFELANADYVGYEIQHEATQIGRVTR
jgi:hypothetical protein